MGKNPTNPELESFLWYLEYYYFHFLFVECFSAYLRAPCVPPIGPTHAQFCRQKQWWKSCTGPEHRRWEARDRVQQSCPENRERKCIFLGRLSQLQPKRQSHPLLQTTGVTQINHQHEITQAERYFRKYSTPWVTYSSIMPLEI